LEKPSDVPSEVDADRLLAGRVLSGDEAAFEALVEKYHPRLFRIIHGIVGDWQRSEDVCQEVFVSVYLKLAEFNHRARLYTWLYRIAVNAALKARGKRARHRELALEAVGLEDGRGPSREDDPARGLANSELVDKVLRPLPRHLRAAVILKELEGLSYAEIAAVLGCTTGAVEQKLHRAFTMLREIWKGRLEDLGLEG
jgi:RNA polymerase sigma-70 factor (ECF subfamily)